MGRGKKYMSVRAMFNVFVVATLAVLGVVIYILSVAATALSEASGLTTTVSAVLVVTFLVSTVACMMGVRNQYPSQ